MSIVVLLQLMLGYSLRGGIGQGVPYIATITDLLYFHIWALIVSDSPNRTLQQ
jgi:hypothetical protein